MAKRSKVAAFYQELLADEDRLVLPQEPENSRMSWFVFVVKLDDKFTRQNRDDIMAKLRAEGIGCSNYFTPIHLQPFIQERLNTTEGMFPNTESISDRTIALPFHNNLPESDIEYVCSKLRVAIDSVE